jgi:predicted SAM-dependent methyltransferase
VTELQPALIKETTIVLSRRIRGALHRFVSEERLAWASQRGHVKIVVGANSKYEKDWLPTEVEFLDLLRPEHFQRMFSKFAARAILAEHVWEHLSLADGVRAARNCFEHLMPGGYVRAAVPDGLHPDPEYIDWVKPGGKGPAAHEHRVLYTYRTFADVFERAGFRVRLLEYFDEAGRFQSTDWDPADGMITRSLRFDHRNADGKPHFTSIVLDAQKI